MKFIVSVFLVLTLVAAAPAPATKVEDLFVRGDANGNGRVDIGDPVYTLTVLFLKGPTPGCWDAVDSNDDGIIGIADPFHMLRYLFSFGPRPPAPFGVCGPDPTRDSLDCLIGACP